jgi:peroxiredoxin
LIQRNEAKKNQGKPDRSARFAWLARTSVVTKNNKHPNNKQQTFFHLSSHLKTTFWQASFS